MDFRWYCGGLYGGALRRRQVEDGDDPKDGLAACNIWLEEGNAKEDAGGTVSWNTL